MIADDSTRERIRLVELELSYTNDFIKGVVAVSAAIRASVVALWSAFVGIAFNTSQPALMIMAAVLAALLGLIDGYHGWLYSEALNRVRYIERLLGSYFNVLGRGADNPSEGTKFSGELRSHRFGLYRSFRRSFSLRSLLKARPKILFVLLYPSLVIVALASAGWLYSA